MINVRLMTWCPDSVSGMHLPAFAAAEGGLFAEQGLEVQFVPSSSAPEALAAGAADFALTGAVQLLTAQTKVAERLPVRFVAAFHQRNPIVGVVREDSGYHTPADLAGVRASRWNIPWYTQEFAGALTAMGVCAPAIVDTPGSLDAALGSGVVDVLPMWMDNVTPALAQGMTLYHAGEGFKVRAIPLDIPVYSTGLLAADRLPTEVVRGMLAAITAGHQLQREQPEIGLAGFLRCFPKVSEQHARVNWSLYEPYAFDGAAPGTMDAGRLADTIAHTARTHGLVSPPEEQVFRLTA